VALGFGSFESLFATFLATHLYSAALIAGAMEAPGSPVPDRIVLLVAGTLAPSKLAVALVVLAGAVGAMLADHLVYAMGRRRGADLLARWCRRTRIPESRMQRATVYFRRFGPGAIVLGRFSTIVRFATSMLSGCERMSYGRFLVCDAAGALLYASRWVLVGYVFSEHVGVAMTWLGHRPGALFVPAAIAAISGYRLYRVRTCADGERDFIYERPSPVSRRSTIA
jgi:membrane protein DedA with SNARE-associated domain